MAEIITRPGPKGLRYYVRYVDADGVRRMKKAPGEGMSKSEGKKAAEKFAAAVETRIANGKVGIVEPTKEEKARRTITVGELFDKFIAEYHPENVHNLHKYRVQTGSIYRANVRDVLGSMVACAVEAKHVQAMVQSVRDDDKSKGTITAALRVLSKLYSWGRVMRYIDCDNPTVGVKRPKVEASVNFFDVAEVGRLLAHVEQHAGELAPGLHPMVATAVYAGLRKGELFGLRWVDVNLDRARLTVARSYRQIPKGGRERIVPLNPELVPLLRAWRDACPQTPEGLVFPVRDERARGWRMGRTDTMLDIETVLRAAQCRVFDKPWHAFRHTFASHYIMHGGNVVALQQLLGHSKLEMTMIYVKITDDFKVAEVARMSYPRPTAAGVADLAEARRRRELAASDERSAEG